jgi:hypothetical protein
VNTTVLTELGSKGSIEDGSVHETTDGDQIIQVAIRDLNWQKKASKAAAHYTKADNTKTDAHPADSRKMKSQRGGRPKRSQFVVQQMAQAATHPMESAGLELSGDLFTDDWENTSEARPSISPEQAWR